MITIDPDEDTRLMRCLGIAMVVGGITLVLAVIGAWTPLSWMLGM